MSFIKTKRKNLIVSDRTISAIINPIEIIQFTQRPSTHTQISITTCPCTCAFIYRPTLDLDLSPVDPPKLGKLPLLISNQQITDASVVCLPHEVFDNFTIILFASLQDERCPNQTSVRCCSARRIEQSNKAPSLRVCDWYELRTPNNAPHPES